MAKNGRRQKARLAARIRDWENIKGTHSEKSCRVVNSTFHKPGSNKK